MSFFRRFVCFGGLWVGGRADGWVGWVGWDWGGGANLCGVERDIVCAFVPLPDYRLFQNCSCRIDGAGGLQIWGLVGMGHVRKVACVFCKLPFVIQCSWSCAVYGIVIF